MKIGLTSIIAAACLTGQMAAAGTLYDCSVKQKQGPRGWVSERLALVIDDAGKGQIIDALTLHFKTGPKSARLRKSGDNLRITWSFSAVTDSAGTLIPNVNYNATLNTETGAFKIRGKPPRFPESVTGMGTCVTRKDLSTRQLNQLLRG